MTHPLKCQIPACIKQYNLLLYTWRKANVGPHPTPATLTGLVKVAFNDFSFPFLAKTRAAFAFSGLHFVLECRADYAQKLEPVRAPGGAGSFHAWHPEMAPGSRPQLRSSCATVSLSRLLNSPTLKQPDSELHLHKGA